jgi:hypothetical protein
MIEWVERIKKRVGIKFKYNQKLMKMVMVLVKNWIIIFEYFIKNVRNFKFQNIFIMKDFRLYYWLIFYIFF